MSSAAATMPVAVRFANYGGDHRASIGLPMGPNMLGEIMWVVDAEHDEAANRTRLGFSYLNPHPPAVKS